MDPELFRTRIFIQDRLFDIMLQRQPQPVTDIAKMKFKDIAKRLEEGLFKMALSKEEYTNLDTLESRVRALIKRRSDQRSSLQQPAGSMMLKPGMSHNSMESSMMASGTGNSMAATNGNTGNLIPSGGMHNDSFNIPDGSLSNGFQQLSIGMQRMIPTPGSQMMPTPGSQIN